MATDAPSTGERPSAPASDRLIGESLSHIQTIQVAAEAIDALALGVEVMLEDQRKLMRDSGASALMLDNELWSGAGVLLTMVRDRAATIGKLVETIETAGVRAPSAAAAA